MNSARQLKRQDRIARIVGNVGSKQRAIRAQWAPTIRFYEAQVAHLEELMRIQREDPELFAKAVDALTSSTNSKAPSV